MHHQQPDIAALSRQSRRYTEIAFGLMALAALVFALALHYSALPPALAGEARDIIVASFVGLAGLDAFLLVVWERLSARISGER